MVADDPTVAVPAELYAKLSELLGKSGAESVEELVSRIVRDWISKQGTTAAKTSPISAEDEKVVEERLKSLGYL